MMNKGQQCRQSYKKVEAQRIKKMFLCSMCYVNPNSMDVIVWNGIVESCATALKSVLRDATDDVYRGMLSGTRLRWILKRAMDNVHLVAVSYTHLHYSVNVVTF